MSELSIRRAINGGEIMGDHTLRGVEEGEEWDPELEKKAMNLEYEKEMARIKTPEYAAEIRDQGLEQLEGLPDDREVVIMRTDREETFTVGQLRRWLDDLGDINNPFTGGFAAEGIFALVSTDVAEHAKKFEKFLKEYKLEQLEKIEKYKDTDMVVIASRGKLDYPAWREVGELRREIEDTDARDLLSYESGQEKYWRVISDDPNFDIDAAVIIGKERERQALEGVLNQVTHENATLQRRYFDQLKDVPDDHKIIVRFPHSSKEIVRTAGEFKNLMSRVTTNSFQDIGLPIIEDMGETIDVKNDDTKTLGGGEEKTKE